MDTTAAAQQAGVTVATVRIWARMGAVRAAKVARRWVIDAASLAHRITLGIRRTRQENAMPLTPGDLRPIATWARTGRCMWEMRAQLAHNERGTRLIAADLLVRDDKYGVEITDLGRQVGTDITNAMANGTDRAAATNDALTKAGL
ncbi:hypothetical protein [Bacillus mobilis]